MSESAKEERFQERRERERVSSGRRGMGWRARETEEEEKEEEKEEEAGTNQPWRKNVDPCGYRTLVPLFAVPADARSMRCGLAVNLGLSLLLPQSSDVGELKSKSSLAPTADAWNCHQRFSIALDSKTRADTVRVG